MMVTSAQTIRREANRRAPVQTVRLDATSVPAVAARWQRRPTTVNHAAKRRRWTLFVDDEAFSVPVLDVNHAFALLSPLSLFRQMDPVQKAVINHTFGMPLIKTKRPVISCNVCQIRFNSEVQNVRILLFFALTPFMSCFFFPLECSGGLHPIF